MATFPQGTHPRDIRDAATLTRIVNRMVHENDIYDVGFCPLKQTSNRRVKMMVREVSPAGLAAFKADGAMTPLVKGDVDLREEWIDLVTISEKYVLNATDMLNLNSPDENVARMSMQTVVERAAQLRRRNIQRTIWMAYKAVQDGLSIVYDGNAAISINYDLEGVNQNAKNFSSSHKPTAGTDWNHVGSDGLYDADVITDVYNWTYLIANDLGVARNQCIAHMNSNTFRYLRWNKHIKDELSSTQPRQITPTQTEIVNILELASIQIVDGYYHEQEAYPRTAPLTKSRWIPDGKVLFTAPYTINGDETLMDMMDGPVVMWRNGGFVVAANPGAASEIYASQEQMTESVRVTTARIPVMNHPEGLVWASVY